MRQTDPAPDAFYESGTRRSAWVVGEFPAKVEPGAPIVVPEAALEWAELKAARCNRNGALVRRSVEAAWGLVQDSLTPNKHPGGPARWAFEGASWTNYGWTFCFPSWSTGEEVRVFRAVCKNQGAMCGAHRSWIVAFSGLMSGAQQVFVHAGAGTKVEVADEAYWKALWDTVVSRRVEMLPNVLRNVRPLTKL